MSKLHNAISERNPKYKNIIVTVVEGEHFGEKALFSKNKVLFESKRNGFLGKNIKSILRQTKSGIITIEGNRLFCEIFGYEKKLVICGGGHVTVPLIKMAMMADYYVIVIETLGGGYVEANIKIKAMNMMNNDLIKPELFEVDLVGWEQEEELLCGGVIEVFLEMIE